MDLGLDSDDQSDAYEIRARTPYVYYAKLFRAIDGDTMLLDIDVGFFSTNSIYTGRALGKHFTEKLFLKF